MTPALPIFIAALTGAVAVVAYCLGFIAGSSRKPTPPSPQPPTVIYLRPVGVVQVQQPDEEDDPADYWKRGEQGPGEH